MKRIVCPHRLDPFTASAWAAIALVLGACSGTPFTASQGAGGSANDGGSSSSGSAGLSSGGADLDAGNEVEAGAANEEGGGAGAQNGEGGEANGGSANGGASGSNPSGGNANGGHPSGGNPSAGSGGQPVISTFKAFDDFVASAEHWTVTGDVSTESAALYSGGGGNPDGAIYWIDGGGSLWYFNAPAKYLGDASAFYDGVLRFDLKITAITSLSESADVLLTSDTLTLAYDCTPDPKTAYTRYTVRLKETGWKVGSLSGAAATSAQFKQVLSKLTRLRIRGEFNTGSDTGHLDNVYLGMP